MLGARVDVFVLQVVGLDVVAGDARSVEAAA